MTLKVYLIDRDPEMVKAWSDVFEGYPNVKIIHGDYFSIKTEAIVSPANSFGIMDGGLDKLIRDVVGWETEQTLQRQILSSYFGELPVGEALMLHTETGEYNQMISAPTMRIPENVHNTLNAYLAFRAVLRVLKFSGVQSVTVPGMCTGIGGMSPRKSAGQMKCAYDMMNQSARVPSYDSIHKMHKSMQTII